MTALSPVTVDSSADQMSIIRNDTKVRLKRQDGDRQPGNDLSTACPIETEYYRPHILVN